MKHNANNSEAVSPVIGVILMVAITVILAAVIAAFVFGMAGQIQKTKVVTFTLARTTPGSVIATFQGGQDSGALISTNFTINGATTPLFDNNASIGHSFTMACPTNSHIVGVGNFNDGSQQVIVEATL